MRLKNLLAIAALFLPLLADAQGPLKPITDLNSDKTLNRIDAAHPVPPAPASVSVSVSSSQDANGFPVGNAHVFWPAVTGAVSYKIYRNWSYPYSPHKLELAGSVPATSLSFDEQAPLYVGVQYLVSAVNANGEGAQAGSSFARIVATPNSKVWGFADTHTHQFANDAFGGGIFWGDAGEHGKTMDVALPDCGPIHQHIQNGAVLAGVALGALIGPLAAPIAGTVPIVGPALSIDMPFLAAAAGGVAGDYGVKTAHPGNKGYTSFEDWPRYNTMVHQQMYKTWLQRAYLGGLRLMVMHAVNNETLCDAARAIGNVPSNRPCNDIDAVARQIQDAKDMEVELNQECVGANFSFENGCVAPAKGWYHIVTSSSEARQTINEGRLAVVLGIEVDHLFNCGGRGQNCTAQDVHNALEDAFNNLQVRHIFPIHLSDNAFGGMAIYNGLFVLSSSHLNNHPVTVEECTTDPGEAPYGFKANVPGISVSPAGATLRTTCNSQGLTDLGKFFVQDLEHHHMIVDIDHMSRKSLMDTFALPTSQNYPQYPLIAGHNNLLSLKKDPDSRHENSRTKGQVAQIRQLGGLVSIGIGDVGGGQQNFQAVEESRIPNDCSGTSKTWYQGYARAVSLMGGWDTAAVPIASDQGLTEFLGPRFSGKYGDGCPGGTAAERSAQAGTPQVTYPVDVASPGAHIKLMQDVASSTRSFDYNTDGMAHLGLYPDFVQDVSNLIKFHGGNPTQELGPLFRSAEAYIQMWAKAEQTTVPMPALPVPIRTMTIHVQQGSQSGTNSWVIVTAEDSVTHAAVSGTVTVGSGTGSPVTSVTGSKLIFANCKTVSGVGGSKTKDFALCNGNVSANGFTTVTFTAGTDPLD